MKEPKSEVFNMDNMEFMRGCKDGQFDLAIVDPPYGLDKRLTTGGSGKLRETPFVKLYTNKDWDVLPSKEYWEQLFRISKNQVIFGANYFLDFLPSTRGFVCWDKIQSMPSLSACELVWTSFDKPAKIMKKASTDLDRFHPTQKPVFVYEFMLQYCGAKEGDKILDTHLGSGSSRIACWNMKFDFTGIELDKEYFDASVKRFNTHKSQLKIF